jgi:hypothetical protein
MQDKIREKISTEHDMGDEESNTLVVEYFPPPDLLIC